ncbi:MAG: N-acetylornithine carbamoyltransferase [Planctomycetota bacterium JB042]
MIDLKGRHFLSTLDFSVEEIRSIVDFALRMKGDQTMGMLPGRVFGMIFFNPSVRTRVSSESAMARMGGHAIALHPGRDTWNFEHREGIVMDGNTQEHVKELAPVLSSMCDAVGIRKSELVTTGLSKAEVTTSYDELKQDAFIHAFAKHSRKPVVNLESNSSHPLQGLADMAAMVEKLDGPPKGKKYVLTWAYHPKPLPVATPHSQLLAAADLGMDVTILRPDGWDLAPEMVEAARGRTESQGGSLTVTADQEAAYSGADVVCAKSWGSLDYYGRFDEESAAKDAIRPDWTVDEAKMARTNDALFMHCLPVRRGIVVTDGVIDSRNSIVTTEAENRLWTVAALLQCLIAG